jgi:hypothetical protein
MDRAAFFLFLGSPIYANSPSNRFATITKLSSGFLGLSSLFGGLGSRGGFPRPGSIVGGFFGGRSGFLSSFCAETVSVNAAKTKNVNIACLKTFIAIYRPLP